MRVLITCSLLLLSTVGFSGCGALVEAQYNSDLAAWEANHPGEELTPEVREEIWNGAQQKVYGKGTELGLKLATGDYIGFGVVGAAFLVTLVGGLFRRRRKRP